MRTMERVYFIDYLRAFMVLLVVFDHSMHGYTQYFSNFWFIQDIEKSVFLDVWHMHNDAIMMPFLFFLAGMFVMPSFQRRGPLSFLKERFLRLGVPFVLGVFFIVPFMVYHKKVISEGLSDGFFTWWFDYYIRWTDQPFEHLSQGGFWFLQYLLVLTLGLLLISKVIPPFMGGLKKITTVFMEKPILGFLVISLSATALLAGSDFMWGAHWWIGFKPISYVRAARFLVKILFFFLGAGVSAAGVLENKKILQNWGRSWKIWVVLALGVGALYISYSLSYFYEGAYNNEIRRFFYTGGQWSDAFPEFLEYGPPVLFRNFLLGTFMVSLTGMYMSLFYRFLNKPIPVWQSLSACSFGIYIFHEPFVTWMNVVFYDSSLSAIVKFLIASGVSLLVSWVLVGRFLLKVPGFKRIL